MTEWISQNFFLLQVGLSVVLVLLYINAKLSKDLKSNFKSREADRNLNFARGKNATATAHAKSKPTVYQLTGIRLEGQPHEILGVPALATEKEVQSAYRDLMKQYHPDLVGRPDSREWKDAQVIAETINRARNQMLDKIKNRS